MVRWLILWPRWHASGLHRAIELGGEAGLPRGQIALFARVGLQIVQFDRPARLGPDGFPVSAPHRLHGDLAGERASLGVVARMFPIELSVRLLTFPQQRGQHIVKSPGERTDFAGGNTARPAYDHRHANAALIEVALTSAKRAGVQEEVVAETNAAVIASEEHDGVLFEIQFLQERQDLANVAIEPGHHTGESGPGLGPRSLTSVLTRQRRSLRKFPPILGDGVLGHMKAAVGNRQRQVGKERTSPVPADELERLGGEDVVGVGPIGSARAPDEESLRVRRSPSGSRW